MISTIYRLILIYVICFGFVYATEPIPESSLAYHYRIYVSDVYDGDTVTVDISLGFGVTLVDQKLRLFGINTPEVRGPEKPEGIITRDRLREKINGKKLIMYSHEDDKGKYGRWLATLWFQEEDGTWLNINQWLIDENLGKPATY